MKTIDKDRAELKRLVESYGKEDVLNYVKHLNEFEAGGMDWGKTYVSRDSAGHQIEVPYNIMVNLHTLGQYAEEIHNIAYNGAKSKYFPGWEGKPAQLVDRELSPVMGLLSNRTNIPGDEHAITMKDVKSLIPNLQKLSIWKIPILSEVSKRLLGLLK